MRDNLNIAARTGLTFLYFANGRLRSVSDWTGRLWQYSYDADGNLDFALNPLAQKIDYSYQAGGVGNGPHDLTEVILPELRNGQPVKTTFQYYRNGRAFSQKNGLSQGETLEYDFYRRSTRITDPRGAVRTHTYDANGALTQLDEPDGGVLTFDNQSDGLLYRKYDVVGYVTQYSYRSDRSFGSVSDAGGNVTRERDALSKEVDITYGPYDQVSLIKDKNGHARRFVYAATTTASASGCGDITGKLKETRADVGGQLDVLLAEQNYDRFGNPCLSREYIEAGHATRFRQTDWFLDANGHRSESKYNLRGEVVSVTNANGNLTSLIDANTIAELYPSNAYCCTENRSYDEFKRLMQRNDAQNNLTFYTYDLLGNRTSVNTAGRRIATLKYDDAGRLIEVVDPLIEMPLDKTVKYVWDEANNVVQ